jgi:predicted AlkP superfamily pyrophosphatase or phosphodiesterase
MKPLFKKIASGVLIASVLIGCASFSPDSKPTESATPLSIPRPRLIALIVMDGLPQRQLEDYRDQFGADGFARFMEHGAWFANAHFDHAYTVTAAGHAVLLTGASPDRTGIIGNEWRDPATGEQVYCASDRAALYIGQPTRPLDGTSPRNLRAETVGDVLRRSDPRSRVIAISGKDRGAILTAGKIGTAYMYMGSSGQFASSTYYMPAHPPWVDEFNAARPADRYFKASWTALLPQSAYQRGPAAAPSGPATTTGLPITYGAQQDQAPGARFYGSLLQGPFADALTLDFARAAVAGEKLGQGAAPDILVVSLSGHDYVNHTFSAESSLSHDHALQLDRLLQAFFKDLDAAVGRDNYIAALTSDHGFMPTPEYSRRRGLDTGRIASAAMLASVNAGLEQRFGPGKWVIGLSGATLALDQTLIQRQKLDRQAVAAQARTLLMAEVGVAAAYTREELLGGLRLGDPLFESMRKSWHADVSGDVQFALKPNWMFGVGSHATHGSPYDYDTHVPLMLWGPRWVGTAALSDRVGIVDLAPTLAHWLQIAAPAESEGHLLPVPAP